MQACYFTYSVLKTRPTVAGSSIIPDYSSNDLREPAWTRKIKPLY